MKYTEKYRAYPDREQERWVYAEFKHQKRLFNYMLQMRSQMYHYGGISVSKIDQINHLKKLREGNTYYSDHPQDMQVSTIKRLDQAYDHFFRRCKDPKEKKKGCPKFKGFVHSVTWELRKYTLKSGERVRQNPIRETGNQRHNLLKVPKLGEVKIRQHRPLRGDPKEVTLKKTARGWYCFIVCEVPDTLKCVPKSACGVDVGTKDFLTDSTGAPVPNPRFRQREEKKLAELQRQLARKEKGSKRYWKARNALAKQHDKIACQRLDSIAKTAYKLFHHKGFDAVVAENLDVKRMVKHKGFAKSISDVAWGEFFHWCQWIAKRDGKHFHTVPPEHTSKTCSNCCQRVKKKMRVHIRTFKCEHCGFEIDRDHNAAINILNRAACALRGSEVWDTILAETRNPLLQQACWG
ncbi:transposase [Candidatus Poribacteria bacterium]|nr:MAG: transposase [Candidatus Poribacteria bacterium]